MSIVFTTNGSRGCPTASCSLIEAAEDMLVMINTDEGLVILNTDRIAMISRSSKSDLGEFKIITDIVLSVNPREEFQMRYDRYQYQEFFVTKQELEGLLSKLPEAITFPQI